MRHLQYVIEKEDDSKTIGMYLKEKRYSRAVIITLKKYPDGIKKNGEWANVNEKLKEGDVIDIRLVEEKISEQIQASEIKIDILYEDEDILVINKPYNMPIHPSVNHHTNTLANAVMGYYKSKGEEKVFRCINRLDRDTSGVTIVAKNLLSASILAKDLMLHDIQRTYIAIVEGETPNEGKITLPIGRQEGSIIARQVDIENGQEAITHYKRILKGDINGESYSVIQLKLETGRTHQIRVHMKGIGHPLWGDFLYNPTNTIVSRQALHAKEIVFVHPITKNKMSINAPNPSDIKKYI
ncbi:MAG: RluA family pseudouridine synthase [Cellulosilyticaceae bacterium]